MNNQCGAFPIVLQYLNIWYQPIIDDIRAFFNIYSKS